MKVCSYCKIEKPIECLSRKGNGLQSVCKECHALYRKNHYKINKQKYIDKSSKWKTQQKIEFYNWLATKQCQLCGINDFRVLEFHHKDQTKEFEISQKVGLIKLSTLLDEIAKCSILCANCHRIETSKQFDYYSYMRV